MSLVHYSDSDDSSDGEGGGLVAYAPAANKPASNASTEKKANAESGGVVVLIPDLTTAKPLEQPIAPEIADLISSNKIDISLLPPWPTGSINKTVVAKVDKLKTHKTEKGADINAVIFKNKAFRNPSIYEKLIDVMSLDETGTNFPKEVFDPSIWRKEDKCTALSAAQKEFERNRGKARQDRTEIAFAPAQKSKKRKIPVEESLAQLEVVKRKLEAFQKQMKNAAV